jgi:hypothetical protein
VFSEVTSLADLELHDFCGFDLLTAIKGFWMFRELLRAFVFCYFAG